MFKTFFDVLSRECMLCDMETTNNELLVDTKETKLSVPGAIVAAGIIVALAVIYTGGNKTDSANAKQSAERPAPSAVALSVAPVTSADHLLGNPNAKVKVIEFSDLQCPFCQRFHPTMKQVMDTYGKNGKVAWIYRHFPLPFHPLAMPGAIASECVAEQGGNIMFWNYLDAVFAVGLTEEKVLADSANKLGVDMVKYTKCVSANPHKAYIDAQAQDGLNAGVSGTPYSIVVAANGKMFPINGSLPYDDVKSIIELALKEN
jgi:protein-disulfide isomerase